MSEFTVEQLNARAASMPRAVSIYDEVLAICADNLPDFLRDHNLPVPRTYDYAGVRIEGDKWPALLVGGSVRTDASGHFYMDSNLVAIIFAFAGPVITREQLRTATDAVQLIRVLMAMPTVVGPRYADPETRTSIIWNTLLPAAQGVSPVPPNYPHFQGMQAHFDVNQYPVTANLWPTGDDT